MFAEGALNSLSQFRRRGCVEPADGFDRDQLLFECPRELGRGGDPLQKRFASLRWERSIGEGG